MKKAEWAETADLGTDSERVERSSSRGRLPKWLFRIAAWIGSRGQGAVLAWAVAAMLGFAPQAALAAPPGLTSMQFTAQLLEKAGIVTIPGNGLGEPGEGYVRLALTVPKERMEEALARLAKLG